MLKLSKLTVTNSYSVRYLDVSWEVAETTEDTTQYTFCVLRSLSSDGDFIPVTGVESQTYSYRDTSVNLLDTAIKYYYRIKITSSTTGESFIDPLVGYLNPGKLDFIAETIMFQEQYTLRYVINDDDPERRFKLLIRRRFGQRCPVCWDTIRKASIKSNCVVCFSTGFTGGYMNPSLHFVSISPANYQLATDVNDIREKENLVSGWMSNLPILQPDDILIDAVNKRYRIVNVQPTMKAQYVLRQQFTAQVLPPTDIAYQIPV